LDDADMTTLEVKTGGFLQYQGTPLCPNETQVLSVEELALLKWGTLEKMREKVRELEDRVPAIKKKRQREHENDLKMEMRRNADKKEIEERYNKDKELAEAGDIRRSKRNRTIKSYQDANDMLDL
jgi:hypothetical protein